METKNAKSNSDLKKVAIQLYQTIDAKDWNSFLSMAAENATIQVANAPVMPLGEAANLKLLYSAFPDGRHQIDEIFAEGDSVITRCTFHGTHLGTFRGLEPTGKRISFRVVHIDRFEEGMLSHHFGMPDMFTLMEQLKSSN